MIREQALRQPDAFVDKIKERTVFYNLEYVVDVLPFLSAADVPHGTFVAVINQSYHIRSMVENLKSVALLKLSLQPVVKVPFLPSSAFVVQAVEYSIGNLHKSILDGKLSANKFDGEEDRDKFYAGYLKTFLQRIIKDLTTVSDDIRFYRFLCGVATITGSAVNYANLGNATDISSPTAKTRLAFLEVTGIVHLLLHIEHASLKRVAKGPKVYFTDTGLAAYLLRINNEEDLLKSTYFTAFFETYVVNAIRGSYLENGLEAGLTYFRDSNAKEISVLLKYGDVLYPIDIKKEQPNIMKLRKKLKLIAPIEKDGVQIGNGCVISLNKNIEQLAENSWEVGAGCL